MKKFVIILLMLSLFVPAGICAEEYNSETYKASTNRLIQLFVVAYSKLNTSISETYYKNGKYYTKFEDVWNLAVKNTQYETITGGIAYPGSVRTEIKYTKLKNVCSAIPLNPTAGNACAKLVVDVNGFSAGTNKFISDKNTLLLKDRFVLYLYSNGVSPEKGSIEETLLFLHYGK